LRASERAAAAPTSQFGSRLRHARLTKGMSLKQVSELAGCTESFLSKVENEKVNPSLTMLHRIVAVLELNTAALFSQRDVNAGPVAVMRAGERPLIKVDPLRRGPGIQLERLVANPEAALLQANIHRVAAKGSTEGWIQHDGEELGYVISGELELTVDGVTQRVSAGDSFFFHSNLPHGYRNPGTQEAVVVWVNTPPTF
jgi:quercetin dioxygenase-like cupin family protein/DNA-binding XRE family transcriptional regulator